MQRHVHDAQAVAIEHHAELPRAGPLGKDFGVTGVRKARRAKPFLVKRGRDDAVRLSAEREVDGGAEKVIGGPAGGGANLARCNLGQILLARLQADNGRCRGLSFTGMGRGSNASRRTDECQTFL